MFFLEIRIVVVEGRGVLQSREWKWLVVEFKRKDKSCGSILLANKEQQLLADR